MDASSQDAKPSSSKRQSLMKCARCMVPGCSADLVMEGKPYCLRRSICSKHMQAECVLCGSKLFRFCHQCGKLEPLSCFDGCKRSCRAMLRKRRARKLHEAGAASAPHTLLLHNTLCPEHPRSADVCSPMLANSGPWMPVCFTASSSQAAAAVPAAVPAVAECPLPLEPRGAGLNAIEVVNSINLSMMLTDELRSAPADAAAAASIMQHQQQLLQSVLWGAGASPGPTVASPMACASSIGSAGASGPFEMMLQQLLAEELSNMASSNSSRRQSLDGRYWAEPGSPGSGLGSLAGCLMGPCTTCSNCSPGCPMQQSSGYPLLEPELGLPQLAALASAPVAAAGAVGATVNYIAAPAPAPAAATATNAAAPAAAAAAASDSNAVRMQALRDGLAAVSARLKNLQEQVQSCVLVEPSRLQGNRQLSGISTICSY